MQCRVMPHFDLELFVRNPTLEQIELCRKEDLLAIAKHFSFPVSKQSLKSELRAQVVDKLAEMNVLALPPVAPVQADGAQLEGSLGSPPRAAAGEAVGHAAPIDDLEGGVRRKTPFTLPRFEPLSPGSSGRRDEARAKVRIARLQLESQEQARQANREFRLQVKKMEIEADTAVRLKQLELDAQRQAQSVSSVPVGMSSASSSLSHSHFDISKHVALVPPFREAEVDSYFNTFERLAIALKWPEEMWPLLLQCKIHGKAQEVVSALPLADSLQYDIVKEAILRAYELVPEAYRQKFRGHRKTPSQTYVEFARDKGTLFDRWCSACKVTDFAELRELILIEEFKRSLPERMVVHLNEHKVRSLSAAAIMADEFVLTHKVVYPSSFPGPDRPRPASFSPGPASRAPSGVKEERECFYCHKPGHVIANCLTLKRKEQSHSAPPVRHPKGVGLIKVNPSDTQPTPCGSGLDPCFQPFTFDVAVSLPGDPGEARPIRVLRDTGGSQSIILASALPFSEKSACGYSVVLSGIEMGYVPRPLHFVRVHSKLVSGVFPVAICPALPIRGVTMLLGNDIAGGKVIPSLEVLDTAPRVLFRPDEAVQPGEFPSCVITRAQSRRHAEEGKDDNNANVDLTDTMFSKLFTDDAVSAPVPESPASTTVMKARHSCSASSTSAQVPITREKLIAAQKANPSLGKCFASVGSKAPPSLGPAVFLLDNGVLVRRWSPSSGDEFDCGVVVQIVIPAVYRDQILSLAHESPWAGHLGVNKTYDLILRHFFWPGQKSDVVKHCRTCRTCQVVGKPNQVIPPAPLRPIPVVGEPFERVLVDCVGPLPRTKAGHQYLLTIMCTSTRFPEAVPLRKITANVVTRALTKFFTTFGLPRTVQTDQGVSEPAV